MQPHALLDSGDQKFVEAYRRGKKPLYYLSTICGYLLLWDMAFLVQELAWRRESDFVLPPYTAIFFWFIALIPPALLRRRPSDEARQHFQQFGSLPKSRWITPLVIAIVLLAIVAADELFIWIFWQYPVTSWFTGRKY